MQKKVMNSVRIFREAVCFVLTAYVPS